MGGGGGGWGEVARKVELLELGGGGHWGERCALEVVSCSRGQAERGLTLAGLGCEVGHACVC